MSNIILISGRGGSGKTTTALALFKSFENVALIQADKMVDFEPFEVGDKLNRIKMRNCSALIHTYADGGITNIIAEGFVQNQFELNAVEKRFSQHTIYVFWLELDKDARIARVANRGRGTDDDPTTMAIYEAASTEPWPFKSTISQLNALNMTELNTDQVIARIMCLIG